LLDIVRIIKSREDKFRGGRGEHALERREMHAEFCSQNVNEMICLEDLGVGGRIIFKWILKK
jgi:hypothetical protein